MIDLRFRPLTKWPGEKTAPTSRPYRSPFKAGYTDTLQKLEHELKLLTAKARRTHPDRGGSPADFQRVNEARKVLDAHLGVRNEMTV